VANFPPLSLIPVVHLDLCISPRIFKKIKNTLMLFSGALGKMIHEKIPEAKNLVQLHCPFNNLLELSTWIKVPQEGWRTISILI
jgi:hypothetical protein